MRSREMKDYRWWAVSGAALALVGMLALGSEGGAPDPLSLVSPPVSFHPTVLAAASNNAQVTRTAAGLWITYTEDGEGNPIAPMAFAQDITTGDMWFTSGYGAMIELSAAGQWMTYTLEDFGYELPRRLSAVAVDAAGHTWLGICKPYLPYDPQTEGGVIEIAPDGTWTDHTGQLNRCIYSTVADRSGNVWFFERDSITRFDGASWQVYLPFPGSVIEQNYEDVLTTIDRGYRGWYVEAPDRVWCFNNLIGHGANVYDGSQWTTYTEDDGLAHEIVSSMGVDRNGWKWFSTAGGVSILDDNGTLAKDDDVWTTLDDIDALDIAVDGEGKVWMVIRDPTTFEGRGVTVWDGSEWQTYDTSNSGLPHNDIYDIFVDDENVKWFGTEGGLTLLVENPSQVFLPLVMKGASP